MAAKLKKASRPTYSDELATSILDRMAAGESLREICSKKGMPDERLVRMWAVDDHEGFGQRYARARMVQALRFADEIVDIANEPIPRDADGRGDNAAVQDKRLRIDTLKWLVGKLHPRVFGDKLQIGGDPTGVPIQLSDVQIRHQVEALLAVATERKAQDPALGNGDPPRLEATSAELDPERIAAARARYTDDDIHPDVAGVHLLDRGECIVVLQQGDRFSAPHRVLQSAAEILQAARGVPIVMPHAGEPLARALAKRDAKVQLVNNERARQALREALRPESGRALALVADDADYLAAVGMALCYSPSAPAVQLPPEPPRPTPRLSASTLARVDRRDVHATPAYDPYAEMR